MRILIAETSYYVSFHGEAIFTYNLSKGLAQRGHEVLVMVNSERGRGYREDFHGVHLAAPDTLSLRSLHPNAALPFFPGIAAEGIIRAFRPNLVHIQDHYPISRSVALAARRHRVKLVGTNHFMPENLAPYIPFAAQIKPFYKWVLWSWMLELYNRLDAVAAPSRTAAEIVRARGLKPGVVPISCGVDVQLFSPAHKGDREYIYRRYGLDPRKTTFFFVGRVDKEKRLDVILHALHLLDRDDLQFVIAGNGTVVRRLKRLVRKLKLDKRVAFTGFIPNADLPAVLNSIDIFTMPSEAELLSIATLEAMACARPVLAAKAIALPELVADEVNGYLFKPGDVDDAARHIALLADQPERWAEMGKASLERAQAHSLENMVTHYEAMYTAVLEGLPVAQTVDAGRPIRNRRSTVS
jgi:1,2-diacylglycerol 3-alpha-glucosyltransferase